MRGGGDSTLNFYLIKKKKRGGGGTKTRFSRAEGDEVVLMKGEGGGGQKFHPFRDWSLLTTRLKDIYIQTFDTYCRDSINSEKCKVINACQQDLYETKPYLSQLRSANVRSMFTKMRKDANCTLDSQLRSFRNTKTKDPL